MLLTYQDIRSPLASYTLGVAMLPALIAPLAAYLYAMSYDLNQERVGQFIADLLIPPLGIIRGVILFFAA